MVSQISSSGSSKGSDLDLPELENDLVTTPEDVEALRRIRRDDRSRYSLLYMNELQLPEWLAGPPRRATSKGWEPFEF